MPLHIEPFPCRLFLRQSLDPATLVTSHIETVDVPASEKAQVTEMFHCAVSILLQFPQSNTASNKGPASLRPNSSDLLRSNEITPIVGRAFPPN